MMRRMSWRHGKNEWPDERGSLRDISAGALNARSLIVPLNESG
jgi:hypothetical protein